MRSLEKLSLVVIHHSASPRSTTVERIRHWHKERGWQDVGYHFVIEGEGEIKRGRPLTEIGAHCRGHNMDSIGVCVVGDNTKPEHSWVLPQVASLMEVLSALRLVFPGIAIYGHRDLAATECPGVDVREILKHCATSP